jgi:prepilin signal peptidase PulO-like enzyme (type II secretory pathway)
MLSLETIDLFIVIGLSIILGGLFGSFATALIYRLPRGIPIAFGAHSKCGGHGDGAARSYCLKCNHQLGVLDLIPFVSYLFLKGRCRYCKEPYGPIYFLVEAASILCVLGLLLTYGLTVSTLIYVAAIPVLLSLLVIDLKHYILPNGLVVALWLLGVCAYMGSVSISAPISVFVTFGAFVLLDSALYAALAFLVGVAFTRILKKEALGLGDVKFFAAAGVWIGLVLLPAFLMIAGVVGLLHGGFMRLRYKSTIFPFGPSLIISLVICYLFKDVIILYFYG